MNLIRELVSGKKVRLKQSDYNLDLTYITPRVIAMSYPAEGFETSYRNDIDDVVAYLHEEHSKYYKIYNLSNRKYNYDKFKQVVDYKWVDHHSPPIDMLMSLVHDIDDFLNQNLYNIVVVHCRAGKGRTGTAICAYMLWSGLTNNFTQTLQYYSKKRFSNFHLGVTQPSQRRYVYYMHHLIQNKKQKFETQVKAMKSMKITKFNNLKKPIIQILIVPNEQQIPFTEGNVNYHKEFVSDSSAVVSAAINRSQSTLQFEGPQSLPLTKNTSKITNESSQSISDFWDFNFSNQEGGPLYLSGDILIYVYQEKKVKSKNLFRLAFNTSFIKNNQIQLVSNDIDPDSIGKNKKYNNLKIIIDFEDINENMFNTDLEKVAYLKSMYEESLRQNQVVNQIMTNYQQRTMTQSKLLLYGDVDCYDWDETLQQAENDASHIVLNAFQDCHQIN